MGLRQDFQSEAKFETEPDARLVIDGIFGYLRKLSPGVSEGAEKLTKDTINFVRWFVKERMGWEVVERYEEKEGSEGVAGGYREKFQLQENLVTIMANEHAAERHLSTRYVGQEPRVLHQSVNRIFAIAVELAEEQHLHCKYVSSDVAKRFEQLDTYPSREATSRAKIRIVVPRGKSGKGFVDVTRGDMKTLLEERLVNNNSQRSSDLETLLLSGETSMLRVGAYQQAIKPLTEWDKDSPGEPPWLVLSLSHEQEEFRVRDPRMFTHINVVVGSELVPQQVSFDFAHVPIWGEEADQYAASVMYRALNRWKPTEEGSLQTFWKRPGEVWWSTKTQVERFEDVVGGDKEAVFGVDENRDELLLNLAKKLDAFQIDVELDMGEAVGNYVRAHSKGWGGAVGLTNLAVLLVDGQAPFFMVDHKGKRGLQVALGLGGARPSGQTTRFDCQDSK